MRFRHSALATKHLLAGALFSTPNITGVSHHRDVFTTIPDSKNGEAVLLTNASVS
jgi:hypothetical protein